MPRLQALEAFQRAAHIDPRNISIALHLGQTLFNSVTCPRLIRCSNRPTNLTQPTSEVAFTYARILMGQDDPRSAMPALETVVRSNPSDPAPFVDYCPSHPPHPRRGRQSYGSSAPRFGDYAGTPRSIALLGESLAAENNYPASLRAYQTALDTTLAQNPEWRAQLSYGLGGVALHLGQVEIAITASLEAVHLDPQNFRPHCQLAEAYQTAEPHPRCLPISQ